MRTPNQPNPFQIGCLLILPKPTSVVEEDIRPNPISMIIIGRPTIKSKIKYTNKNAPPPPSPTIYGNRHILPKPIENAAVVIIKDNRFDH